MSNERSASRISAWFMLALFLCWVVAAAITMVNGAAKYEWKTSFSDYLNGKAANHTENWFKEHLIWEPAATGFWGAARYGFFNTGNKGVVIGKDDWLYTREEFEWPKTAAEEMRNKLEYIQITRDFLEQNQSKLLIVPLPSKARIYPEFAPHAMPADKAAIYPDLLKSLKKERVAFVDAEAEMLFAKAEGQQMFLKTDTHWTPKGAQVIADAVGDVFRGQSYDATETLLEDGEPEHIDGDLLRFIPAGWLEGALTPSGDLIATVKAKQKSAGGGLFGDVSIPFALVGTSYSAIESWHFEDYLKYALQADVLNIADEGQGPFTPMQAYLQRIKDGEAAAPFVIWEIPERFMTTEYDVDFSVFEVK